MSPRRRGVVPEPERSRLLVAHAAAQTASVEFRRAVWAAYRAGGPIREIAGELGMSTNTIQQRTKDARAQDTGAKGGDGDEQRGRSR